MKVATREAAVAPVSEGLRISKSPPRNSGCDFVPHCGRGCGSTASSTLGEKIGGSKVKQEKGCGS